MISKKFYFSVCCVMVILFTFNPAYGKNAIATTNDGHQYALPVAPLNANFACNNANLEGHGSESDIWKGSIIGSGFNKGSFEAGFSAGALYGIKILGSRQTYDLAMGTVNFGWIFSDVLAPDKWYAGNLELRGELFDVTHFNPNSRYIAGFTTFLRYNIVTDTPWVPFVEFGAGLSGTDIGKPDLSTPFEFNLQSGVGIYYFFQKDKAISCEYRLLHVSNARIKTPDDGVDSTGIIFALNWFF